MILSNLPALIIVLPLIGALIIAMIRVEWLSWALTLLICLCLPVMAWILLQTTLHAEYISYAVGNWQPPLGIELRIDVLNAYVLLLISVIAAVLIPYALSSVRAEIEAPRRSWYYAALLLCISGLLGITVTGDAFNAFVFLEISSLASYTLIAMGKDRRSLLASYQYLILGTIGATFYVIGVGFLYTMTGTLNLADMAQRLTEVTEKGPILAAFCFIFVGLSLKLALFPLHAWLPNAYTYAPSVTTIFLSATATKASLYLLLRYIFTVFGNVDIVDVIPTREVIIGLSLIAMFAASIAAIYQNNVKRMLAYSSVAQIGYIMLGVGLMSATSLTGGLVHIFNHGLMKTALFMVLGAVALRIGSVHLNDMAGLGRKMPLTITAFILSGLSLIGVPGTVGFVSKWYLAVGAVEIGYWWIAFLIMASSILALIYIGKVVEVVWFREPSPKIADVKEAPFVMLTTCWVVTIYLIYFGFNTDLTVGVAQYAAESLLAGGK